jgi:hypothetical protein
VVQKQQGLQNLWLTFKMQQQGERERERENSSILAGYDVNRTLLVSKVVKNKEEALDVNAQSGKHDCLF